MIKRVYDNDDVYFIYGVERAGDICKIWGCNVRIETKYRYFKGIDKSGRGNE